MTISLSEESEEVVPQHEGGNLRLGALQAAPRQAAQTAVFFHLGKGSLHRLTTPAV